MSITLCRARTCILSTITAYYVPSLPTFSHHSPTISPHLPHCLLFPLLMRTCVCPLMRHHCPLYSSPFYRRDDLVLAHGEHFVAATELDKGNKKRKVRQVEGKNNSKKRTTVPSPTMKNDRKSSNSVPRRKKNGNWALLTVLISFP